MLSQISKAEFLSLMTMTISGVFLIVSFIFLIEIDSDSYMAEYSPKRFENERKKYMKVASISALVLCISSIAFLLV